MHNRRVQIVAAAVALVAIVSVILLQTAPFAQEGGAPGPGAPPGGAGPGGPEAMPGGMPGGPGGMPGGGGAPGGATFQWKAYPAPTELTKTYDEWLAMTGTPRAQIPQAFLVDATTNQPARYTPNEWFQLHRIYAARGAEREGPVEGAVGKAVMGWFEPWAATKVSQAKALVEAYKAGLNSFSFEVGFPVSGGMTFDASTASVTQVNNIIIPVIMRVKPSAQKAYGELVYRKLKRFDCYGHGRDIGGSIVNTSQPFSIVTYKGGYWQPRVLNLEPEMGPIWAALWSASEITLTLYDPDDKPIASASQSAGHNGGILGKILYPDKIYYQPRYKLLIPPEGRRFGGGKWHIEGTKGWVYAFSFSMPSSDVRRIHRAKVEYTGVDNPLDLARGQLASASMTPPPGGAAAAAGAAGGGPGGGPGGMPGMPGMGGPEGGAPGMSMSAPMGGPPGGAAPGMSSAPPGP